MTTKNTVLMFSGGRDSTIAALRLHEAGYRQTLVTVTSDHLNGIGAVERRLVELTAHLHGDTRWLQLRQPSMPDERKFNGQSCLPCHYAYVALAGRVLRQTAAKSIAFGYSKYQSDWPEQTPIAVATLASVLRKHDIELLLPVSDLSSKEDVVRLLEERGLSPAALEQKCSRQLTNRAFAEPELIREIATWQQAIDIALSESSSPALEVLSARNLSEFRS